MLYLFSQPFFFFFLLVSFLVPFFRLSLLLTAGYFESLEETREGAGVGGGRSGEEGWGAGAGAGGGRREEEGKEAMLFSVLELDPCVFFTLSYFLALIKSIHSPPPLFPFPPFLPYLPLLLSTHYYHAFTRPAISHTYLDPPLHTLPAYTYVLRN